MNYESIAIIGAGQLGMALTTVLESVGHSVRTYDIHVEKMPRPASLKHTLDGARVVILAIPTHALHESLAEVVPLAAAGSLFLLFSKGLSEPNGERSDEIIMPHLGPGYDFVVCGGPMIAAELSNHGGEILAGFRTADGLEVVRRIFRDSHVYVAGNPDFRAVALAGVLKNIYALLLGVADGLGVGGNRKAMMLERAAGEMEIITKYFGLDIGVVRGPAGLGDLVATAYSPYSSNRSIGEMIGSGRDWRGKLSEGLVSIPLLEKRLSREVRMKLPLMNCLFLTYREEYRLIDLAIRRIF